METMTLTITEKKVSGLFADILNRGIDLRVQVTGKSMAPAIRSGQVVAIRKTAPDTLRMGDLIFFRNKESLVLHRILFKKSINSNALVLRTKGDAARSLDEPVQLNQVLGRVSEIHQEDRSGKWDTRDMQSFRWKIRNKLIAVRHLGVLVCHHTIARVKEALLRCFP